MIVRFHPAQQSWPRTPTIVQREVTGAWQHNRLKPLDLSIETFEKFELRANKDPFDIMLLAQAEHHGFQFLTSDLEILRLKLDYVLDLTD